MPGFRSPPRFPACAAALLGALGALAGCGGDPTPAGGPPPPTVETTTVQPQPLRDVATFSGQLSAENSVVVKAETDGVVEEQLFEEGQDVAAGAVLLRLKSDEQRARLHEAEANLALAREVYERTKALATRDAISQAKRDEATAQLAVDEARVELARVELAKTEIKAPFAGVLGMRLVSIGDRVTDETPLVQIDAVDRLQVAFAISELGILFTRVGAPVEVRVAPYPGVVFPGEVFFVSPTLDPATRRIIAKAWVPNQDHRLRAGLFATVDMEVGHHDAAIVIPESAVVFDRAGAYVWKIGDGGVASRVPVQVGLRKEGRVEITLGLQPGDTIVTAGTNKVVEGKKVVAANSHEAPQGQARREVSAGAGEGT